MTLSKRPIEELRSVKTERVEAYLYDLLGEGVFYHLVNDMLKSGTIFASAPSNLEMHNNAILHSGLAELGYSIADRLDLISSVVGGSKIAVLDPYFSVKNLLHHCEDTQLLDTDIGSWQLSGLSNLMCCLDACNYFFPMAFVANAFEIEPAVNYQVKFYKHITERSEALLIDAFDNDGFLMWIRG